MLVKITVDEAEIDQSNLLEITAKFNNKSKPRLIEDKKSDTHESLCALYEGQEWTLNAFKSGIFTIKKTQGKGFKVLTHKQMLQRLPIALAQVKKDNTSESLLNKIWQIVYSLY